MSRSTVADVMTRQVIFLAAETTIDEAAAQVMRDRQIGDVVVTRGPTMSGLVTDRDIVVRAIAPGLSPKTTTIGEIATQELMMVEETTTVDEAVQAMRERAVRRLLVCDADRNLTGIISLSDVVLHPHLGELTASGELTAGPA